MKRLLPLFLVVPGLLFAEPQVRILPRSSPLGTAAPKESLPENYQITLTFTGLDPAPLEVCLAVGSPVFSTTLGEHGLEFSGSVDLAAGNTVVISYWLAWEIPLNSGPATMVRKSSTQGSVRLELGNSQVLFRAGKQNAQVSIQKLDMAKP